MAKSKNKGINVITIIVILILIIITVVVTRKIIAKNNKNEQVNNVTNQIENQVENETEKNVKVLEDGTKLNISSKLKENKKLDNLEIKDIQLTYKDGVTNLLATVENIKKEKISMTNVSIQLVDESGKEIYTFNGIIEETKAGETANINCSITADFANAYDFKIVKK